MENQQKSYVGIINGATLANLWNSKRSRLFWLNVRSSLGETYTNKNIIETAKEEPTNFFYYNNGISCLAPHNLPYK